MPEWATEVLTWDQIQEIVDIGTVESLGRLRRSEQQLKTYHAFMDKVSKHFKALQHL
jgi:predicted ATPase